MDFSFHELLKIVLTDTGLTPPDLAIRLDRERSSIYKWLSGKHQPRASYIPQIVALALEKATASQKVLLIKHMTGYVTNSTLPYEIKETLLCNAENHTAFLQETLVIALSKESLQNTWPDKVMSPEKSAWYERYGKVSICAMATAALGGLLWNFSNHLLGWTYYMGSPGNEPYGFSAFMWGFLTLLPLAIISTIFLKKHLALKTMITALLAYLIVGGLSALLFYTSGIRVGIENLGFSYEMREIIIVIIYSLIISLPPYITLRTITRSALNSKITALYVGLPVVAALVAVILTLFISRPEIEVVGVRGLLVGMLMRSCMFYVMIKH